MELRADAHRFGLSPNNPDRRDNLSTGDFMASIIGFGGVFLRAEDPKALYQW
jgi:hypothetical protein